MTVKLKTPPVQGPPTLEQADEEEGENQDEREQLLRPRIYAGLLEKKSDCPSVLQKLLAQVRCENGSMPEELVYRVHSDMGSEFLNEQLGDYLKFHAIMHSTTQGYDPSSNGAAESTVGLIKRRSRYLLSGSRLTTK